MNEPKRYLPEIDGLRAVAVIAVIVGHFFEDWLPSGFLGVDIFFVISGFVITCHLRTVRPTGWKEYLSDFYARRIKRIVPALLFCVFITNLLFLLLTTRPARGIFATGGLSLVGLSNIYLFKTSTEYFSLDAKLNPFTHTWSLGIEEQFYLFFPLLLALTGFVPSIGKRRRHGTFFLVALAVTSFLFYLAIFHVSEMAAYYLIPSRIWELSVGALTFLLYERKERLHNWGISSLWVFIPLLLVLTSSAIHQTVITTACVGLTSLVLFFINPGDVTHRLLTMRPLIFVGLLSYSLYLWHWTILVLGKWTLGSTPVAKGVLLAAVFACAMFSYFLIEKPLRYKPWSRGSFTTISYGAIAAVFIASLSIFIAPRFVMNYNNLVSSAFGIEQVEDWGEKLPCYTEAVHVRFKDPYEECLSAKRTAEKPHAVYLVGDSHAAQLVFMAEKAFRTLPFSVRFLNAEDEGFEEFPDAYVLGKGHVQTKTLTHILNDAQRGDCVIIAFHRGHLNDILHKHVPISRDIPINEATTNFLRNARTLVIELRGKGVKVILVNDTPLMQVVSTSPSCALQIRLFGESACKVSLAQDLHTRYRQDLAFNELKSSFENVFVWDPLPVMYEKSDSIDVLDEEGNYIMFDWNHITEYQSELLAETFRQFFESTL